MLGRYTVTVDLEGFKKAVSAGILLQGGDSLRHDVTMQVGVLTEIVEVRSSTEGLSDTRPDVSHTVNEKYYRDLPIVTAADVRLAEAVLQIQPGYLPMKPNGDPMFRGSQFNSRINGGQTMATENVFDGAAFGYAVGHQQSHESTPPVEAIQEVKVITTTYSAQYGHTSGGFIEYTPSPAPTPFGEACTSTSRTIRSMQGASSPSGHDSAEEQQLRRHGGRAGGHPEGLRRPQQDVLLHQPRLDQLLLRRSAGLRQHDADRRLQERRLQLAADGHPGGNRRTRPRHFRGQIFNPATTRLVNGVPVRDPYPGNIIPRRRPAAEPGGGQDRSA